MAQTYSIYNNHKTPSGQELTFRAVLAAEAYVLGTGLTLTIPGELLAKVNQGVPWADFQTDCHVQSLTNGTTPVVVKNVTSGQLNLRLWNDAVEQATGAITLNLLITLVMYQPAV
jgi:hypothetical protein